MLDHANCVLLSLYKLNGNKLQQTEDKKDVRITVSSNMKPSVQCKQVLAKAMQVLRMIKRHVVLTDEEDVHGEDT